MVYGMCVLENRYILNIIIIIILYYTGLCVLVYSKLSLQILHSFFLTMCTHCRDFFLKNRSGEGKSRFLKS